MCGRDGPDAVLRVRSDVQTASYPNNPPPNPQLVRRHSAPSALVSDGAALGPAAQKWLSACRRGSYADVSSGIREGWAPVNAVEASGYTALMRCCVSGQMLDLILGCRDVDVNLTGAADGTTPLHLAARYRTPRSVEVLLRMGAAIERRDAKGSTVLHKAAANPNERTLQREHVDWVFPPARAQRRGAAAV